MYRWLTAIAYCVATILLTTGYGHGFTITNVGAVTLGTDGNCTPANQTRFRWTQEITGTLVDRTSGGGVEYDTVAAGWVDGTNKIIATFGVDIEVGNTASNSAIDLYSANTPTVGPYRRFVVDLIGTSTYPPGLTQGNTYDPTGHIELLNEEFDAHTLDPDCPAAPVTGASNEQTRELIAGFMLNRANHILGNQTNLTGFVTGANTGNGATLGNLAINGDQQGLALAFSTSRSKILAGIEASHARADKAQNRIERAFATKDVGRSSNVQTALLSFDKQADTGQSADKQRQDSGVSTYDQADDRVGRAGTWDIWTEFYGSTSNSSTTDSALWVGYIGFHTFVTDDMLVGVMGQLDRAQETNTSQNSEADGTGWMVGPYIAGKIPDHNLYYEARALWGQSSNDISPIGTYSDQFDTTRWLASARVSGSYVVGDVTISPQALVSWFEETQASYTDSIAQFIPEQTISLGEVRFGPTLSRTIRMDNGTIVQPSFGISGAWNFGIRQNTASQGFALGNDDLRARLDGGLSSTNALGWQLALSAYYDGLGINDYDSYGASIKLTIPLQ